MLNVSCSTVRLDVYMSILQYAAEAYQLLLTSDGVKIFAPLTIWLYDVH